MTDKTHRVTVALVKLNVGGVPITTMAVAAQNEDSHSFDRARDFPDEESSEHLSMSAKTESLPEASGITVHGTDWKKREVEVPLNGSTG